MLFNELKSRFGLDEINTTDPYIIEALIIMAAISLLMSQAIVDELRELDAKQHMRLRPPRTPTSRRRGFPAVGVHWPSNATLI